MSVSTELSLSCGVDETNERYGSFTVTLHLAVKFPIFVFTQTVVVPFATPLIIPDALTFTILSLSLHQVNSLAAPTGDNDAVSVFSSSMFIAVADGNDTPVGFTDLTTT